MAAWVDEYVRGAVAGHGPIPRTHMRVRLGARLRSAGSTLFYRGTNTPSPMTEIAENRLVGRARAGPLPSLMATACCGAAAGSAPPDSGVQSRGGCVLARGGAGGGALEPRSDAAGRGGYSNARRRVPSPETRRRAEAGTWEPGTWAALAAPAARGVGYIARFVVRRI